MGIGDWGLGIWDLGLWGGGARHKTKPKTHTTKTQKKKKIIN